MCGLIRTITDSHTQWDRKNRGRGDSSASEVCWSDSPQTVVLACRDHHFYIFHQDPGLHSLCFSIILLWFLAVFNHILWSFQSWHLLEWLLILIARLLNFQSLLKEFIFVSKQVALHNAISFLGSQPYYPWADVFIFSPNFLEPYFTNKLQVLRI